MIILSASDICKSYGTEVILENISFHINAGDRVGIVGANGAGKSTLLNIISGQMKADSGNCFVGKDTTIGYLRQRDNFDDDLTVIEEVNNIFTDMVAMEEEILQLNEEIAKETNPDAAKPLWNRLNALQHEFEIKGGYTYKSEISGVLTSMAFGEEYYNQSTGSLSGGERTRLALACLLLRKPDILFLDEPTNHLDIGTLKWLEQYLKAYKGTIVVISHDRYFLDQTVNHIFEIHNHHIDCYSGNYSEYMVKKHAARDAQLKAYENQQTKIKREEDLIRRFKERGTEKLAKRAASREKRLAHLELLDRPESEKKPIKVDFNQNLKSGNDVLFAENLAAGYDNRRLFEHASFDVKRGEKICVVGANGVGKSTLLKIIMEELTPKDGFLKIGHNVEIGYYDQGQQLLDDSLTVMDEIHNTFRGYTDGEVRGLLGRFLFTDDMVFRNVGSLSGGEKARLALLKLMLSGSNLLLLDEPTNHLDIESKEAFEEALMDYPGTVITVTHDRYFLNRIPDRIFELEPNGIKNYLGKYDYYMEKKAEIESSKAYLRNILNSDEERVAKAGTLSAAQERELKKKKEAEDRRRAREKERLENLIENLEARISDMEAKMCEPEYLSDHVKLAEMSRELSDMKTELDDTYDKWAEL